MLPLTSDLNFTPTSTALFGPGSTKTGTAVLGQMVKFAGIAAIVMLSALVVVKTGLAESVAWTIKLKVPAAVGVPVIAPVVGVKLRPPGNEPLVIDQVYGGVPPLAANGGVE